MGLAKVSDQSRALGPGMTRNEIGARAIATSASFLPLCPAYFDHFQALPADLPIGKCKTLWRGSGWANTLMEEKQFCSPSYMVIFRGYHKSKEALAHMRTCYQYDFCKLLLCLLSPFSCKVQILHSIFHKHELVIEYQLRQRLLLQLSVLPSASIPGLQPRRLLGQDMEPASRRMPTSGMQIPGTAQLSLGFGCFTALSSCSLNRMDSA